MLEAITGVSTYTGAETSLDGDRYGNGCRRGMIREAYSGGAFQFGGGTNSVPLDTYPKVPFDLAARNIEQPIDVTVVKLRKPLARLIFSRRQTA